MAASVFATIYNSLSLGNILLLFSSVANVALPDGAVRVQEHAAWSALYVSPCFRECVFLDSKTEKLTDAFKSLKENYGRIFSMKLGSYKFVMASTPEAVYEMLVKKSADFAGRPQNVCFLYPKSIGGKDIILGDYGPEWKFQRRLFTSALRQYLSNIPLIERRVSTQAEKLVQFMQEQDGKPFDPAECLMRGVANVICGITFGEGCDTTNPDLDRLLKLNKKNHSECRC
ncbi:hypothetical protein OS493_019179 [Desmophyllum pertusum]|uniref:Cytochrome P450 n=1 Tax=Desmophyllum pertusum TaxID=174260 RepID=A0A9W9YBI6_9CNID|nr:hypothetical protein OS493_019179 [Desmophyllum pertusum]